MIVNYLDPSLETHPEWLPETLPDEVSAVLADTRWPEGSLHGLNLARHRNVPAILDADLPVPGDGQLVRAATHVAFSAAGLADYCDDGDPESALRAVDESTEAWCCVTLGREGTLCVNDGELRRIAAFDVPVRDTLGAGDVWHGAFALAVGDGKSAVDAVLFASAAAALKVANGGGRAGSPLRGDVDEFLREQEPENEA